MSKHINEPHITNSPFQRGRKWRASGGLDAKVALNDFTLDVTVNPDYGQVELDPSVMNLSAYETFYDEKRPFFLEGKHILEFDNDEDGMMFYSRRIGRSEERRVGKEWPSRRQRSERTKDRERTEHNAVH